MCDRNVKSEYILKKLVYLYLFLNISVKELPNFVRKILFDSGVINIQIPMTKYLGFQYSVAYCSHLSLVNS